MKIRDLKIKNQLFIGLGAMMVLILALGIFAYRQSTKIHKQTELIYEHPVKVKHAIGELGKDIMTIRVGMRDLLILSNSVQKQEISANIEVATADAHNQFDILKMQYLGPQTDIVEAENAFIKWNEAIKENQKLFDSGQFESAKNNLLYFGQVGIKQEVMSKEIKDIDDFATQKAQFLYQNSQDIAQSLNTQLFVIIAIILVLMIVLDFGLYGLIQNPIKELSDSARRFRDGDMSARSQIDSNNEFGELSNSFNSMFQSVQTTTELNKKTAALAELMLLVEDPKNFFVSILPAIAGFTNSQMAAVYLLSNDKKQFEHYHSFGMENQARQAFAADNFEGEFGSVLSSKKIQTISRIPKDTRFIFHTVSGKLVPREIITIPVLSGKEVVAIISLASIRTYTPQSELLIHNVQHTLSARVEGIIAYVRLQELSAKLELQNRELETQKTELFAQSTELTEQNRELETQKNQLNEANRLKTNFLSNMSHELRTPLNSVIALSGVLNRRLMNKIPADEYSYIEVIERNGKHLLSLINDVLDISRIEAGHEDIEISKFSVNDLVADLQNMIQPQAKLKNIELKLKENDKEVFINSDISKCRHIMQNLIGNAVKFTEKGKVEIEVLQKEDHIEISVVDSGIGISDNNIAHIFNEFRQADATTSRRYGGTGLGLAIAKKYANLLGGTISVKSTPDIGSTFTLILPLKYNEENKIVETKTDFHEIKPLIPLLPAKPDSSKSILLVDDSEPALIQLRDILEQANYRILEAHNGSEALGIISANIPDAIILDLMMPEIDGFQVLETIRNAESTANIPVLILTAKQLTKEDLKFLKRNNVHQLIQKGDVNRAELLKTVTDLVFVDTPEQVVTKVTLQKIKGKPNVLIVEDNPDNMTTVKALLGDKFRIFDAKDGNEGIKMAKKHIPHLILMDIALPDIDGIEAFKTIRRTGELSHIPVIALTASAMTSERETILSHGFDAYIAKPIDDNDFFSTIDRVLYGK